MIICPLEVVCICRVRERERERERDSVRERVDLVALVVGVGCDKISCL